MGYWQTSKNGESFGVGVNKDGSEMIWGDSPADIIDNALAKVIRVYYQDIGRVPTKEELMAGFLFSVGPYDDLIEDYQKLENDV